MNTGVVPSTADLLNFNAQEAPAAGSPQLANCHRAAPSPAGAHYANPKRPYVRMYATKCLKFYCADDNLRPFLGVIILTAARALAIVHATRPLRETEQEAFLAALKALLVDRIEIGDGELARILWGLQREHFTPASDAEVGSSEQSERTRRSEASRRHLGVLA